MTTKPLEYHCSNDVSEFTNLTKYALKLVLHAKQHCVFQKFIAQMATGWIIRIITEKTDPKDHKIQ